MTRIQTVSLLDNAEDVNLDLPEGLFLVTENRPPKRIARDAK